MCGIAGKVNFDGKPVTQAEIATMCQAIKHRGPDDQGVWTKGPIGLGNRRLSIIDLSPAGNQPISNENKTVWITFNGEIYNFQELRAKLIKKGHRFHSKTDTETIVNLWEEYGVNCLKMLRGMFAFALWDQNQKILFLARDRLGKKPLKYYLDDKVFIFASELKAILTQKVKTEPDYQAIDHFFGMEAVPEPQTGFKQIKKLPAGSYLILKNGQATVKSYWQQNFSSKLKLSEAEWIETIKTKLTEAVKLRLISDVPVGAFLSGGIDSSTVVALMKQLGQERINTFSVGFAGSPDELPYARTVAKMFGTNHHEVVLKPNSWSLLTKLATAYEEPYGDPSALPTFLVSKLAAKAMKVVLSGDGGDENFAGYQRYQKFAFLNPIGRLLPFLNSGPTVYPTAYLGLTAPTGFKKSLYQPQFWDSIDALATKDLFQKQQRKNLKPLDNVLKTDFKLYLGQVLLPKMDSASMANSLEVRSPFLDQELVELTAKIPDKFKLKGLTSKYILKQTVKDLLPQEIIHRPKMGFGFPLDKWLRHEWKNKVKNLLLDPTAKYRTFLKPQAVETMILRPLTGEHYDRRLWRVIMFEYWLRHYFPKL
ncbi:MAG: asparagine synthase (glutamine-hydrolyzing) [Candidatus Levybacteria bacterium RIFCSPLOWO2_01_FULL_38_23]|nr:MAG: asparagine synthase (glutamine-hydrolyzing) [Candidatus Levybacteria bacterium RIFCSPLOWO2_01_FULL_38_23]